MRHSYLSDRQLGHLLFILAIDRKGAGGADGARPTGPPADMMRHMGLPMRRRLATVAVAVLLGVLLTGARSWQVGALGFGFLAIGVALLVQKRRSRGGAGGPGAPGA